MQLKTVEPFANIPLLFSAKHAMNYFSSENGGYQSPKGHLSPSAYGACFASSELGDNEQTVSSKSKHFICNVSFYISVCKHV